MEWKKQLNALEKAKEWDFAIELMENVIKQNPNDMDAYIFMNYLLMNLLVEEDYDESKQDHYIALATRYFRESYAKFSDNLEYLYYTGITAVMSEWFFGLSTEQRNDILDKAKTQNPDFPPVKFEYYWNVFEKDRNNKEALNYARITLSKNSPLKKVLSPMGAIGEYLLDMNTYMAEQMLGIKKYYPSS